jgi:serine/threonine-protein kinase RsbT
MDGPADPAQHLPARLSLAVSTESDVAPTVAAVTRFCTRHQLPALFAAFVATAASELANNLWMHAGRGGHIEVSLLAAAGTPGVELVAEDEGPGIADIEQALVEGYSSAGGLGCGLPGVRRLMDEFSITSAPGRGTRVVARKWMRS